jgi:fructokinase
MAMIERVVTLGVDLGGTKIEAAILERPARAGESGARFEVLRRERVPTFRERGYEAIIDTTADLIVRTAEAERLDLAKLGIGVGMPGAINRGGVVKNSNTVCLNGRPFHRDLMKRLGHEIRFENDANCFSLAEARLGAARGYEKGVVFGVIMGSGVGGGVVVGGKIWSGPQSVAGEWGHHAVGPWWGTESPARQAAGRGEHQATSGAVLGQRPVCYCGKRGCLELYASGIAVETDYERRAGNHLPLAEIAERRAIDVHAEAAIEELLEAFGRGLANVIDILDPSAIVLGGGVSNLSLLYHDGVTRVAKYVFNDELTTPILKHELGDSAGVLGAALLHDR